MVEYVRSPDELPKMLFHIKDCRLNLAVELKSRGVCLANELGPWGSHKCSGSVKLVLLNTRDVPGGYGCDLGWYSYCDRAIKELNDHNSNDGYWKLPRLYVIDSFSHIQLVLF